MPYSCNPLKKPLLIRACSLSDHAVRLSNHKLKYWLLIGSISSVHNFVAACANRRTGQDTCSISIYGKVSLQFLKQVLSIFPIFYLSLLKIITFLKIILRYHSEPDWCLKLFKSLVFMIVGSVTWNHNNSSGSVRWTNNFPTNIQVPGPEEFMNWTEAHGPMPQNELNRMEANPIR